MQFIERFAAALDRFTSFQGRTVAWVSLGIIAIVMLDVVTRRFLTLGSVALQEAEWHLNAILFLGCAGYACVHDGHVRVDVFRTSFSEKTRNLIEFLGSVFFLIPYCLVILVLGVVFVSESYSFNETSSNPGGLPYTYAIKAVIPVGFFLLLIQAVSTALKQGVLLLKKTEPEPRA